MGLDKQPCANCGKEIYQSSGGEWFHHQDGRGPFMSRCNGTSRNEHHDDRYLDWARPLSNAARSEYPAQHSPQRQLLLDAADTVDGERQDQYGNAEDSFATIAELWSSYINIGQPKKDWIDITAKDVAILMVLFKAAREGNSPKRDNLLDLAGYAALAQRIEEKKS